MKNILSFLPWIVGGAGVWSIINGVLHTAFILAEGRNFDRELIRLMIDGLILVFGGLFFLVALMGIKQGELWSFYLVILDSLFLLCYCFLIFKFLPSYFFISINLFVLFIMVYALLKIEL